MKILTFLMGLSIFLMGSVDINNATAKELTQLYGVGEKKSQAIVKYRDTVKCFDSIGALVGVKGIGPKTVEKNKDDIVVGKCKSK